MRKIYAIILLSMTTYSFAEPLLSSSSCLTNLSTLLKNTVPHSDGTIAYTSSMDQNKYYAYMKYSPNDPNQIVYTGLNCKSHGGYPMYCESGPARDSLDHVACSFDEESQTYTFTLNDNFGIHVNFTIPTTTPTSIDGDINAAVRYIGTLDFKGKYEYCGADSIICP